MKKAFIVAATIASLFVMPGSVQAGEMNMKTAVEIRPFICLSSNS